VHPADADASRAHPRSAGAVSAPPAEPPSLTGVTVLVVDDEVDARFLIRRVLQDCGAVVILASSADEGLEVMRSERVDMIVSDIGMPDVDGYEFIRRVRAMRPEEGGRTPAAALTAFARSEDRTRALRAGYIAHVAKPIEPSELLATLSVVAGRFGERQ